MSSLIVFELCQKCLISKGNNWWNYFFLFCHILLTEQGLFFFEYGVNYKKSFVQHWNISRHCWWFFLNFFTVSMGWKQYLNACIVKKFSKSQQIIFFCDGLYCSNLTKLGGYSLEHQRRISIPAPPPPKFAEEY